jgi:hypothetical protein
MWVCEKVPQLANFLNCITHTLLNHILSCVDRTPITEPLALPCLGKELDLADPRCQACPHQPRCRWLYGRRMGRVPLSTSSFKLMPPRLEEIRDKLEDPDMPDLEETYRQCHMAVFERLPADRIGQRPRALEAVPRVAKELNCSVKVMMTTVMMAHQASSPDRDFYATMLAGPSAVRRVEMYRDACRQKFGFFDISAINTLTGEAHTTLDDRLLTSETIFGEFVVGYKMRVGGEPFTEFYRIREQGLDPTWLAIEPTYQEVLMSHVQDPHGSHHIRRHRHAVVQAQRALKLNKRQAAFTFQAREKIMPKAVATVVWRRGINPDHLLVESPVVDAGKMWSRVGLALQHVHLLRFIDGDAAAANELLSF